MTPAERSLFEFAFCGKRICVVPECLGFRSLFSMAVLSTFLVLWNALVLRRRLSAKRVLLLYLAGAALAVLQNAVRIAVTTLSAAVGSESVFSAVHDFAGYATFVFASFALGAVSDRIFRKEKKKRETEKK